MIKSNLLADGQLERRPPAYIAVMAMADNAQSPMGSELTKLRRYLAANYHQETTIHNAQLYRRHQLPLHRTSGR